MSKRRRGPGPSHVLITPDHAGNVVGVDPHKRSLSATVVDPRGGIVASEHFRVSGDGHRGLEAWARQFGPIARWGVEGASSWGRHTAVFLVRAGDDVRDVCANRTPRSDRARQRGKSDTLDSERIARETLAHPLLPRAFKRAGQDSGPDELHELLALWHNQRRSLLASRQHLLNEAESMLCELPLELREQLPDTNAVRPRLGARSPRPPSALRRGDPPASAAARRVPRADRRARSPGEAGRRPSARAGASQRVDALRAVRARGPVGRRAAGRGRRRAPVHRGRVRPLQRHRAVGRVDRRGPRRACAPPLQPRRQPARERDPLPDGDHAAALRAAGQAHLRRGARQRPQQEGRPAGSSSATSPMSSTAACSAMLPGSPPSFPSSLHDRARRDAVERWSALPDERS